MKYIYALFGETPKSVMLRFYTRSCVSAATPWAIAFYHSSEGKIHSAFPNLKPFSSDSLYIQEFISPAGLAFITSLSDTLVDTLRQEIDFVLSTWLTWFQTPEFFPDDDHISVFERDIYIRQKVAENDPGYPLVVEIFGQELAEKFKKALLGSTTSIGEVN